MKMPRYILRIGFQEFAIPTSDGAATLMKLLADAIPVRSNLDAGELTLEWAGDDEAAMLAYSTMVSVKRIPPGTVFKRKTKDGRVETLRPIPITAKRQPARPAPPALEAQRTLRLLAS